MQMKTMNALAQQFAAWVAGPPQREISNYLYPPQKWNISFRPPPRTPSPPKGEMM